jgi:predicted Zn-dependent peptidase
VQTQAEHYTDSGYLMTRAGVPAAKLDLAIEIILKEYKKLKTKLVDRAELKRAKEMIAGRIAIQLESSDNVADFFSRQAVMLETISRERQEKTIKIKTPSELLRDISKVLSIDIRQVAKKIFINKGLNMAVIGPFKGRERFRKILRF